AIAVSLIAIAVSLIAIAVSLIAVAVTVSVSGPAVIIISVGVTIAVAVVVVRIISVRGIPVEERITKIAKEDELIAGRSVMAPIATPIPATPIPATPIPATVCRSASGERLATPRHRAKMPAMSAAGRISVYCGSRQCHRRKAT